MKCKLQYKILIKEELQYTTLIKEDLQYKTPTKEESATCSQKKVNGLVKHF